MKSIFNFSIEKVRFANLIVVISLIVKLVARLIFQMYLVSFLKLHFIKVIQFTIFFNSRRLSKLQFM